MIKIYEKAGFSDNKSKYLWTKGFTSPLSVVQCYEKDHIFSYIKDREFPEGSAALLECLAEYLIWYKSMHNDYSKVSDVFMTSVFETFSPTKVNLPVPKSSPSTDVAGKSDLKIQIVDFPKYSCKSTDWTKFYEQFTAVAKLQGMEDLLINVEAVSYTHLTLPTTSRV